MNTVVVSKEVNLVLVNFSIKVKKNIKTHLLGSSYIIKLLNAYGLGLTNRMLGHLNINCTVFFFLFVSFKKSTYQLQYL